MKFIICDVDCTVYSYREFVEANFLYPKETMAALFSKPSSEGTFPGVQRVWEKNEEAISERIKSLIDKAKPYGEILFVSAFPAEEYKKKTFEKFNIQMISSFPESKISFFKKTDYKNVLLAIGDRPGDLMISKYYQSEVVFIPVYKPLQWSNSSNYTRNLVSKVTSALERIKA